MRRKWTDDDVNSLCEMWGNSSVERICTKLKRSKSSVIKKLIDLSWELFLIIVFTLQNINCLLL